MNKIPAKKLAINIQDAESRREFLTRLRTVKAKLKIDLERLRSFDNKKSKNKINQ